MSALLRLNFVTLPLAVAAIYVAVILMVLPAFLSQGNLVLISYYTALLVPCVIGTYLLILLGLFDLSLGANAALAAVICAKAMSAGVPVSISILLAVAAGGLGGIASWILVAVLRIPALIGTLITMSALRGLALLVTSGRVIGGVPQSLTDRVLGGSGHLVNPILFALVLLLSIEFLSRRHRLFRRLYHAGSNPGAAASNGINVTGLKCVAFTLAGIGAATVGVMQTARTQSASPLAFPELALESIAACIIGGMSLSGGRGAATGCVLGMLILVSSRNIVALAGVDVYWEDLAIALVLFVAVLLGVVRKWRSA
ncbi:MAG: ABC transporter permease [Bryobacterales bacterium]|nr:ABC transporter permease [Bryobacterales bacterium]